MLGEGMAEFGNREGRLLLTGIGCQRKSVFGESLIHTISRNFIFISRL